MHISEGCTLHNVFIVLELLPTIEWGTSTVFIQQSLNCARKQDMKLL